MREKEFDTKDAEMEAKEKEEEEAAASANVLEEPQIVGRIMTKEERTRAITELVAKIPADKEGLWNWPIKWDHCTNVISKNLLEGKFRPFVIKKVIEYTGAEEDDLVNYVIRAVSRKASAEDVYNELQKALDEDTEVFVMKLWRTLIYETEARAQGIV